MRFGRVKLIPQLHAPRVRRAYIKPILATCKCRAPFHANAPARNHPIVPTTAVTYDSQARGLAGRGSRARTRDLRFWRPPLYQLSYTPSPPACRRERALTGLCRRFKSESPSIGHSRDRKCSISPSRRSSLLRGAVGGGLAGAFPERTGSPRRWPLPDADCDSGQCLMPRHRYDRRKVARFVRVAARNVRMADKNGNLPGCTVDAAASVPFNCTALGMTRSAPPPSFRGVEGSLSAAVFSITHSLKEFR